MRLFIAAVLGGIVMFMWGAFSHMVLNIYGTSMKPVPNEAAVISALKENITEPGWYFVPGLDMSRQPTDAEMAAFTEKYKAGPTASIIYQPAGSDIMTSAQLGTELVSNIAAAFMAALILSFAAVGFFRGAIITTLIGVTGWLSINASYWNWYQFPTSFVTAELFDQAVGWFLSGLVIAFIMRTRS